MDLFAEHRKLTIAFAVACAVFVALTTVLVVRARRERVIVLPPTDGGTYDVTTSSVPTTAYDSDLVVSR
jgi:hypothetical protein